MASETITSLNVSPIKQPKEMKTKTFILALTTATAFFIPYILLSTFAVILSFTIYIMNL